MKIRKNPFTLSTEASVNIADDEELMHLMVKAGFDTIFVGIESPNEESLVECRKTQNRRRDLVKSVKKIHSAGMVVQGGFIVGFDNDPENIFDKVISFIKESNIVTAMVGLLNAPIGTKLYKRLHNEGRLLRHMSGDNTDFSMNFIPKMNKELLIEGYQKILTSLYRPKEYYARVKKFLREYHPPKLTFSKLTPAYYSAFVKSLWKLGVIGKERFYYWRLLTWTVFHRPTLFPQAVTFAIYGFHFRKIVENYLSELL